MDLQQEEPADPDEAKIEALSKWAGEPFESPVDYTPANTTPPAAGAAPVTLDGAGAELVQVGVLPVKIGQASPTESDPNPPAPSGTWDVAVEARTSTEEAEVDGALIKVTPPESGSTPVDIQLDYGQFEDLFGTEWSSRLKLTQLPECFLTTPELEECATPVDVPSTNDPSKDTVRATIDPAASQAQGLTTQAGGGPVVLAATDSASGAGGTYKATPLSATGTWTAGGSGGGFSWTYPLTVPEPPAGPAPKIALSYSSQSVDGRTSVANGQASWIGDGWDYHPGFIERRYRSCNDDRSGTPNNDNSKDKKKSDLCWASDNVVMSLGGSTTALVHDDGEAGKWVAQNDTGAKIEYKTKADVTKTDPQSDRYDGEYWLVTTPDGTKYHFGRNNIPGRTAATNSAALVPVFGNDSGEPCHAPAYADSSCDQAWRWNLDYVEDVHGNAMIVDWKKESNFYAQNGKFKSAKSYARDSYPTQILYGLRSDNLNGAPAGKVVFKVAPRCIGDPATTCSDTKFESKNYEDKQRWWDTPSTLYCKDAAANCSITAPTFWSRIRLAAIETWGQRTPGSTALSQVDSWTLAQSFPENRTDTHPPLWLESITRTGYGPADSSGDQPSKALPPVSFLPNTIDMPNRVVKDAQDHTPDFDRLRVKTIRTETGGEIHVDYFPSCVPGDLPAKPEANTTACFPVHWSADPNAFSDEALSTNKPPVEWFTKYLVKSVTEMDLVGRQPNVETKYTYEGDAAWAKNTDEFTRPELRTYDQWRGYESVVVNKGVTSTDPTASDATEQSQTRTRYFRGMSGDAGRATITLMDSTGKVSLGEDLLPFQGMVAETITYTKAGGSVASRQWSKPYHKETASRTRPGTTALKAYRTATETSESIQSISGGRTRTSRIEMKYDDTYGLPLTAETYTLTPNGTGGETVGDQKCTTTAYVHNAEDHLIGLPQRVRTTVGSCEQAATATASQVISDTRTSYDALAAFGTAPVKGLPFQVDTVNGDGTGWITSARTTYDALGRATKVTDAAGNSATVAYSPATGPAFQITSTNAAGHSMTTVLDPARGMALSATDANGRKTTGAYDELGRVTDVWSPSRTQGADQPSVKFKYQIEDKMVPAVRTSILRDNGTYEDSVALYDGLLRPRQTQVEALDGGRIVTDTLYNANGTVRQYNNSYLAKGEPEMQPFYPDTVFEVPNSTEIAYDGLDRPIRTTTMYEDVAQHSTTTRYEGDWTLTRTGMSADGTLPLSGSRAAKTWTDALGRTSRVQHYTAIDLTTTIDTTYAYDPRGMLSQVTDADGNKWTYTYDVRGRLTSSTDPDMGAGYFGYNALDQKIWSKDAQNRTQYTSYDVLGRQTELRDDSVTGTLVAKWTYDTLPGAKGLPVASTRYNDGVAYTTEVTGYDTEYRPTGTKITIPTASQTTGLAGTYAYTYEYTTTGKVQSVTLPATPGGLAAEKVVSRYDGEGSPTTTSGLSWYTAETTLSPFGEVLRTASGEAPRRVWTTNFYNRNTGRLDQTITDRETLNPSRISARSYAYDTVGNITSITDAESSTRIDRQCFAYDPMGRLVHAWTAKTPGCPRTSPAPGAGPDRTDVSASVDGAGYWHSYAFDAIGNRTRMTVHDLTNPALDDDYTYTYGKTPSGNPLPGETAQPHTLTQVDSTVRTPTSTVESRSTYAYDSSGNTTQRVLGGDTQALNWDRRNKLTSADTNNDGTPDVKYIYDANGNRLLEDDGSTRTLYLGEAEIVVTTAGQPVDARRYYSHPGAPTTVRSTAGKTTDHKLTVLLSDHHNTATNAVDQSAGQAVTRRKFDPYGNPRGTEPTNWPDRRTFLGVGIDDPITGLTHIGAREYDASTGRFISADPIMDLTNPLQMNGYTYASGNPLTNWDPSGLFEITGCEQGCVNEKGGGYHDYVAKNGDGQTIYRTVSTTVKATDTSRTTVKVNTSYNAATGRDTIKIAIKHEERAWCSQKYGSCGEWKPASGRQANSEQVHKMLDAAGFVPVLGSFADGLNTALYALEGNWSEAGWALVALVPFVGDAIAAGRKGGNLLDSILQFFRKSPTCTKHSFAAGTKVLMADGSTKPIEELQTGDEVIATNPETGESAAKTVTATIVTKDDKSYVDLSVSTEGGTQTIVTTDHHPFWSESEQAWLDAGALKPGMTLRTDDGSTVSVAATRIYGARQDTYNLTVADLHTYYVLAGATPVLVHNDGGEPVTDDFNRARNQALEWLSSRGFKAEKVTLGKFGTIKGKPVGMQTANGKAGFRIEFDDRSGAHINVWAGKEKGPHFQFNATEATVTKLQALHGCG